MASCNGQDLLNRRQHSLETMPQKVYSLQNTIAINSSNATKNKYGAACIFASYDAWLNAWLGKEFWKRVCVLGARKSESGFKWKGQYHTHTESCAGWCGAELPEKEPFKLDRRVKTRRTGSGLRSRGNYLINAASDIFPLIFKWIDRFYGQEQLFKIIIVSPFVPWRSKNFI